MCREKKNSKAGELSRVFNYDLEWSPAPDIFANILVHYPEMSVDLFAFRLNCKLKNCVSPTAEPHVTAVDAFSIIWTHQL